MTRKDYKAIAKAIEESVKQVYLEVTPHSQREEVWGIERVVESLCVVLKADNPNFQRETFIKACGF